MNIVWSSVILLGQFCVFASIVTLPRTWSLDVTFHSEFNMTVQCMRGTNECSLENLLIKYPAMYNRTGWEPDVPTKLMVESFCQQDSDGMNQAGLRMRWELPNHSGAANINGFDVRLEGYASINRCFLINLSEPVTQRNQQFVFNGTIYPVTRNDKFIVALRSLPNTGGSNDRSVEVTTHSCETTDISSHWCPVGHFNITYTNTMNLQVSWIAPPRQLNFTEFTLSLLMQEHPFNFWKARVSMNSHMFESVPPGNYTVLFEPYNRYPYDLKLCKCRDDHSKCAPCQQCRKSFEAVVSTTPARNDRQLDDEHSYQLHVMYICTSLASIIVLILIVFGIYKCRQPFLHRRMLICVYALREVSEDILASERNLHHVFSRVFGSTVSLVNLHYSDNLQEKLTELLHEHCVGAQTESTTKSTGSFIGIHKIWNCFKKCFFLRASVASHIVLCLVVSDTQMCNINTLHKNVQLKKYIKCSNVLLAKNIVLSVGKKTRSNLMGKTTFYGIENLDRFLLKISKLFGLKKKKIYCSEHSNNELSDDVFFMKEPPQTCHSTNCRHSRTEYSNVNIDSKPIDVCLPDNTEISNKHSMNISQQLGEHNLFNDYSCWASRNAHQPTKACYICHPMCCIHELQCEPWAENDHLLYRDIESNLSTSKCASNNVSFLAPDKSTISEADAASVELYAGNIPQLNSQWKLDTCRVDDDIYQKTQYLQNTNSVESLMDKMMAINKHSSLNCVHIV